MALLSAPVLAGLSWSSPHGFPTDSHDDSEAAEPEHEAEPVWLEATSPGHVTIETAAFVGATSDGKREAGGWIGVAVPLDRLWTPRPKARVAHVIAQDTGEAHAESDGKPPAKRVEAARPRQGLVPPSLARACVAAAWRAHGLGSLSDLDGMSGRARMSGALPEARFRASRAWDRGQKLTPTDSDPYRLQDSTTSSQLIEGRLTWRLDRLLFADEEVAIERLRVQRIQQRTQLAGKVLTSLFDWRRARSAAEDSSLPDEERAEAWLRASEAEAALDVLTGGWFGGWLDNSGG